MRLAVISDELSSDVETAIELAQEMAVSAIELRGVAEDRFPDVSPLMTTRIPELVADAGVSVAALSPGLFKIPLGAPQPRHTRILRWEDAKLYARAQDGQRLVQRHLDELLPRAISAAQALGAPTIVCFSFDRGPDGERRLPDTGVEILREAADRAAAAGLQLAMEVEHICYGDTGARAADIVERVGHAAFGINWDPANAYRGGEDRAFPDGYSSVRAHVRHVHMKNATIDSATGERRFATEGAIDWEGQLAALRADGYSGYVSIETHARPKIAATRRLVETARRLGIDE